MEKIERLYTQDMRVMSLEEIMEGTERYPAIIVNLTGRRERLKIWPGGLKPSDPEFERTLVDNVWGHYLPHLISQESYIDILKDGETIIRGMSIWMI